MSASEHAIWELADGYAEGHSTAPTPEGSAYRDNGEDTYGWFCIEGTAEELTEELRGLGFTDEQIAEARA